MPSGKYIVIEGISGVGKSVIIERLARELQAAQIPVQIATDRTQPQDMTAQTLQRIIDDPRYPVNSRTEVLLYNAARSQALEDIRRAVSAGTVCIADHSYLTTLVTEYYGRGDIADYTVANQIVQYAAGHIQPDLLLVLDAPVSTIKGRLGANQQARFDEAYQERVRAGYLWEAKQRNLPIVYATDPIDTVLAAAWKLVGETVGVPGKEKPAADTRAQSVAEVLAANPPAKAAPAEPPVTANSPAPDNNAQAGTKAGKDEFADYVTNTDGSVYGFSDAVAPAVVTAAMARLHYGDDLRAIVLDELAARAGGSTQRPRQAITTFDDNRAGQFTGRYIVVENASNLLIQKIEQSGIAACFEAFTRQTDFSQKDANGHYRYVIPENLKGKPRSSYIRTINQIFDLYAKLVASTTAHIRATSTVPAKAQDADWRSITKAQACDCLRVLLPVAATGTVGIYASGLILEDLAALLLNDELDEVRTAGRRILEEAGKTSTAASLPRADKPDRQEAITADRMETYVAVHKLAAELLPVNYTAGAKPVALVQYTPRNELDIVADILYQHSDLPLQKIQHQTTGLPYQRKVDVLTAYLGKPLSHHQPGRALKKISYRFDLISDYAVLGELQRYRLIDSLEWQALSPRLGYDVPELVEAAGITEVFEQCFDLSLQLYSELQAAGLAPEAQYTTLLGHKTRWTATYTASAAFRLHEELHSNPHGSPGSRQLVQQMQAGIAEVHPLIAGVMRLTDVHGNQETASLTPTGISRIS